jgi:hypothetical protein
MARQNREVSKAPATAPAEERPDDPTQPAKTFRIRNVRAAVWANPGEYGPMYSVQFSRGYKDGDEWKSTASFGRDDLLVLAEVTRLAFHWIVAQGGKPGGDPRRDGEEVPF